MSGDLIGKAIRDLKRADVSHEEIGEILCSVMPLEELRKFNNFIRRNISQKETKLRIDKLLSTAKTPITIGSYIKRLSELNKDKSREDRQFVAKSSGVHGQPLYLDNKTNINDLTIQEINRVIKFVSSKGDKYDEICVSLKDRKNRGRYWSGSAVYGIRLETDKERSKRIDKKSLQREKKIAEYEELQEKMKKLEEDLKLTE